MRIVHICQRDDPETGGSLRVAEALMKEQSARSLKVWILFLYGPPAQVAAGFEDDQVICLGLRSSSEAWRGITALRKAIRDIAPDIIHSHDGITWPRLALLRIGIPVVMHSHLPAWEPHNLKERLGWALICKTTDVLIGISHHTIDSWVRADYPASQIHYVANGVDFERFRSLGAEEKAVLRHSLGLPASKRILLWVGRLHRTMKGSDRVEHVAARLPDDTVLLVVGHGPEFADIQTRCRPLIESGKMIMTGTVFEPAGYYMAADAFMFTSYHEPFGLVILEAVASGLPIMAFPIAQGGGATELLKEFGAVQIEDGAGAGEIADALRKLKSMTGSAVERRVAAAAKYDWRIISEKVVAVYRSIVDDRPLQVLVCQHGARHRYAIPRMLESEGVLSAFYTDSSAESLLGKCIKLLGGYAPVKWQRFARWDIQGLPREKVFSSDLYCLPELRQMLMMSKKRGIYLYQQRHHYLSSKMQGWGLQGANVVYSMYHENLDFIRWAKQQGIKSVVDVFVSPLTEEIMEREYRFFPDWNGEQDEDAVRLERKLWEETAKVADVLACPSEWVAEGVRATTPLACSKIRVVPYGCSIRYNGAVNSPVEGRVLFAGREPLRKGLHYLAWAATQLKAEMPGLDVRVAGFMPPEVLSHPVCKDLNFLGQLTGKQMEEEYLAADVFVLPALSEGFAGVVAEAIGAGCPVIVTRETGSPIVHEREGLVIPSRDVDALAGAIRRMVADRDFRNRCSARCLDQVPFYSETRWQERLLKMLRECAEG